MKSPIFYSELLGASIDLSRLVEVHNPTLCEYSHGGAGELKFSYRYDFSTELIQQRMRIKYGKHRGQDHPTGWTYADEATEEAYELFRIPQQPRGKMTFVQEPDGEYRAVKRARAEVGQLRAAWMKWKEIEPEVYAIIRKHLT